MRQFSGGQPPVLTGDNGAEPCRGKEHIKIFHPVLSQNRDPVSAPNTLRL